MAVSNKFSSPEVLARIGRLGLRARQAVHGTLAGINKSPLLGQSVEFLDYREYAPGDDLKLLDWRVYGRSNRYTIKLFEEETNLRGTLLLDASNSMRYRGDDSAMSKFDYAATLTASMAHLMIDQRDAVGLMLFDEGEREWLTPSTKKLQLQLILAQLEATEPARTTSIGSVLHRIADEIPRRGLVFLVSDLLCDLDEFFDALGRLKHRAHEIVVFHLLDADEMTMPFSGAVNFKDLEGSEQIMAEPRYFQHVYQAAMETFCEDVRKRLTDFGADYVHMTTDQDLGVALSHYLNRRIRMATKGGRGRGHTPGGKARP